MDYEKKYKDALERAKEVYHRGYYISGDLEYIFPKLKENEDDRIRKSLIDMLKNDEKCYLKEIAWLEKQGKHKLQGKTALEAANEEKVDNQNCVKSADKVDTYYIPKGFHAEIYNDKVVIKKDEKENNKI